MTIRDNKDYIRVLLEAYFSTITGWGGPPMHPPNVYARIFLVVVFRSCRDDKMGSSQNSGPISGFRV